MINKENGKVYKLDDIVKKYQGIKEEERRKEEEELKEKVEWNNKWRNHIKEYFNTGIPIPTSSTTTSSSSSAGRKRKSTIQLGWNILTNLFYRSIDLIGWTTNIKTSIETGIDLPYPSSGISTKVVNVYGTNDPEIERVHFDGVSDSRVTLNNTISLTTDYEFSFEVELLDTTSMIMGNDVSNNSYVQIDSATGSPINISSKTAEVLNFTTIGGISTGDIMRFVKSGTTMTAFKNGGQVQQLSCSSVYELDINILGEYNSGGGSELSVKSFNFNNEHEYLSENVGGVYWYDSIGNNNGISSYIGLDLVSGVETQLSYDNGVNFYYNPTRGDLNIGIRSYKFSDNVPDGSIIGFPKTDLRNLSVRMKFYLVFQDFEASFFAFRDSESDKILCATLNSAAGGANNDWILSGRTSGNVFTPASENMAINDPSVHPRDYEIYEVFIETDNNSIPTRFEVNGVTGTYNPTGNSRVLNTDFTHLGSAFMTRDNGDVNSNFMTSGLLIEAEVNGQLMDYSNNWNGLILNSESQPKEHYTATPIFPDTEFRDIGTTPDLLPPDLPGHGFYTFGTESDLEFESGIEYYFTIYLKSDQMSYIGIYLPGVVSEGFGISFDPVSGLFLSTDDSYWNSTLSVTVTDVGDYWYKIQTSYTTTQLTGGLQFQSLDNARVGSGMYIGGYSLSPDSSGFIETNGTTKIEVRESEDPNNLGYDKYLNPINYYKGLGWNIVSNMIDDSVDITTWDNAAYLSVTFDDIDGPFESQKGVARIANTRNDIGSSLSFNTAGTQDATQYYGVLYLKGGTLTETQFYPPGGGDFTVTWSGGVPTLTQGSIGSVTETALSDGWYRYDFSWVSVGTGGSYFQSVEGSGDYYYMAGFSMSEDSTGFIETTGNKIFDKKLFETSAGSGVDIYGNPIIVDSDGNPI